MHSSGHSGLQTSNTNNNENNAFAPLSKSKQTQTEQFPFNRLPDSVLAQTLSLLPTKHKLSVISKVDSRFRDVLNTATPWDKMHTFGFTFEGIFTLDESELSPGTLVFEVPFKLDPRTEYYIWTYYLRALSLCSNLKCILLRGYEIELHISLLQSIVKKVKQMMDDGQLQYLDMQFSSQDFHRPDVSNNFHSFYKPLAQTVLADTHQMCKVGLLALHLYNLLEPQKEAEDLEYCRLIMALPVVQRLQIHYSCHGLNTVTGDNIPERVRKCELLHLLSGKHVTELRLNEFQCPATLSALCPFLNELKPDCLRSVTLTPSLFHQSSLVDLADSFFNGMNPEQLSQVTVFAVKEVRIFTEEDFTLAIFNHVLSRIVDSVPNLIECRLKYRKISAIMPVAVYNELIELFWSFASVGSITIKASFSFFIVERNAVYPNVADCLQQFRANHSLELEDQTGPMRTEYSTRRSCDMDFKPWQLIENDHPINEHSMKVWYKGAHLDFSLPTSPSEWRKLLKLDEDSDTEAEDVTDDDGLSVTDD